MTGDEAQSRAVTFRLGGELYAVDVQRVERVVRYSAPRAVPRLPEWIEGIVEHEGRVVPVVDLRRRLGLGATGSDAQTRLLLLSTATDWCGLIVDRVLDVRRYALGEVAAPPSLVRGLAGELVRGTLRRGDELVVLLDAEHLFSAAEWHALDAAGAAEARHG